MLLGGERNFVERWSNHSAQKGRVADKSVCQTYLLGEESEAVIRGGTETRAERVFRSVRERRCQSIALGMEGKEVGRVRR